MNSIKGYRIEAECSVVLINDDGVNAFGDIITDYKNKSWCKYSDVEKLLAKIEELENEKKNINEIKAQAIEEAIHHANGAKYIYPQGGDLLVQQYRAELRHYADKLREKHDGL